MDESAKLALGERVKAFREAKKLSQVQLAEALGGTARGLQDNESGRSLPNSKILTGLYRLGANVNWLLSGEGVMMRSEAVKPAQPAINTEALVKAFEVMTATAAPGETVAQTAKKAVDFYIYLLSTGMITTEGIGSGNMANAA